MPKGVGAVSGIIIDAPHGVESPLAAVLTLPSERAFLNPSQILLDQLQQVNNERVAAVEAAQARLAAEAEESTIKASGGSKSGAYSPNGYQPGQCVWGVKEWRPDIPGDWHSAYQWLANARADGWSTGSTPAVGAVGAKGNHVVLVTAVYGDVIQIREMNYDYVPFHQRYREALASEFYYIY